MPNIRWLAPLRHWLRIDIPANLPTNNGPGARSITTNLVFRLPTDSPRLLPFTRPFRDLHPVGPLP